MKKYFQEFIFLMLMLFCSLGFSQDFSAWSKKEVKKAKTAADASYLSENERQVVMYINLARIDGEKFFDTYMEVYQRRYNQLYPSQPMNSKNTYWKSLKKDLKKIKNLRPFIPKKGLTKAARYHAKDMGTSGKVGHESSNGMTTSQRAEKFAGTPYVGENCSYGYEDPLYIVGQLLVDDGVPSLGHRKNILDTDYNYYAIGVAIEPHKEYSYNCVIDFAVEVQDTQGGNFPSASLSSDIDRGKELGKVKGKKRNWKTKYAYDGGKLAKDKNSKKWREKTEGGDVFLFDEIVRKDGLIVLHDDKRGIWLSLDAKKKTCDYSTNGSDWVLLYKLKKK